MSIRHCFGHFPLKAATLKNSPIWLYLVPTKMFDGICYASALPFSSLAMYANINNYPNERSSIGI